MKANQRKEKNTRKVKLAGERQRQREGEKIIMMNLFRLAGDMTHLLSILVLLLKIRTTKSCAGWYYLFYDLYIYIYMSHTRMYIHTHILVCVRFRFPALFSLSNHFCCFSLPQSLSLCLFIFHMHHGRCSFPF